MLIVVLEVFVSTAHVHADLHPIPCLIATTQTITGARHRPIAVITRQIRMISEVTVLRTMTVEETPFVEMDHVVVQVDTTIVMETQITDANLPQHVTDHGNLNRVPKIPTVPIPNYVSQDGVSLPVRVAKTPIVARTGSV